MLKIKKVILIIFLSLGLIFSIGLPWIMPNAFAAQPKAKFYDFNEQLIDGNIKKPTTLYTNARQAVKFERLLKLKKSFLPQLFDTAKERVFR